MDTPGQVPSHPLVSPNDCCVKTSEIYVKYAGTKLNIFAAAASWAP